MPARGGRRLRVGFLGVMHTHAESYARAMAGLAPSTAEIAGVYDHNESHGRGFARRHGTSFKKSPEALLDDVDAVIITSENVFHHRLALTAVRAGKHVLCEKPIALTLRDAEEMREEARRAGVKFQMCHVMRYHTNASVVKGLIDDGRVGDVLAIIGVNKINFSATSTSWFADKKLAGGGAVMDHTVHLADMMRWYTGSEAREVYCEIGGKNVVKRLRVENAFLTTLTFENGVLGHIDGSWSYPAGHVTWGDVTLEVLGSKGVVFLDAFRQSVYLTGMNPPQDRLKWQGYGCNPDAEMVRSFVESVTQDREPVASAEDGIRGLEITLASYESYGKGRPVRLSR